MLGSMSSRDAGSVPSEPFLAALGVSPDDEAVYRALLRSGPTELATLAGTARMSVSALRRAMPRLEELGLVSRLTGPRLRLVATSPHVAVDALAGRRQEEIARARAAADVLAGEMKQGAATAPEELLEVVTGREAVGHSFLQLNLSAREEVMALVQPPFATDLTKAPVTQDQALGRGVRARSIYDVTAFETESLLDWTRRLVAEGEEARVGRVPLKLVIVDSTRAMLPLTSASPDALESAVIVHESALLNALVSLFEMLWRTASPLRTADATSSGDAADSEILALLSAGLKDATVARQLGMSMRTLQRRLSDVFESVDAQTRFQAGYRVGHDHLLDATDPS
jgi:sugar-specific transcriptional regulator TrmB